MSLKSFHIFFIFLAALLCGGFGAWTMWGRSPLANSLLAVGYAGLACSLVLFIYGLWFAFCKSKKLGAS